MKLIAKMIALILALAFFAQPAAADVNDFSFESFDATYHISLNASADNRAEMLVTEKLVALFPDIDQNRGIRRLIPARSYGEFPSLTQVLSVTDENGKPRDYEVTEDTEFVTITSKNADDSFVHGRQTYVIKYRQSWVIKNYQATSGFDEFYWDVNGTGWLQSFGRVSATVTLDSKLSAAVVRDKLSCYQGLSGSTHFCDELKTLNSAFYFAARDLQSGENLTIDIPLKASVANTAGPVYVGTLPWYLFWVFAFLVLLTLLWAVWYRRFAIKNEGAEKFVVPQYLPADQPGLLDTALVSRKTRSLTQALIVELAVKRELEIEAVAETKKDFILRRTQSAKDPNGVLAALGLNRAGDQVLIGPGAGAAMQEQLAKSLNELISSNKKRVAEEGYLLRRKLAVPLLAYLVSLVFFGGWIMASLGLDAITAAGFVVAPSASTGPFTMAFWLLVSKRGYTAKGAEVVNYLSGLELYIRLAEKDRLEFLQSPKGASLKPSEVAGKQVLKLIEAVLPWAILLGLQKQWSKVLNELYERTGQPPIIIGVGNSSTGFSHLSQALASSLAVSQSTGSGGGGSSGGGGGGGGGGGV